MPLGGEPVSLGDGRPVPLRVVAIVRVSLACAVEEPPEAGTAPRVEPPLSPPELSRLVEASLRYASSLRDLAASDPEVMRLVVLLHAKVIRIADGDEALWELDTVPNLLLIERTLDELRAACRRMSGASAAYEATLRAWLAPLLARITPATRASIEALARAGRAPSPFSQLGAAPAGVRAARCAAERS